MKQTILVTVIILAIFSCKQEPKKWHYSETIELGKITPIGFTFQDDNIWISDGDHNQIVAINQSGEIIKTIEDFERPMHLDFEDDILYIPEYGSDKIVKYQNNRRTTLEISDSLDAPAGVDINNAEIAIADFYNHRILYFNGQQWQSIGKEGKEKGELYYPTDVQILSTKIVVADAYNNRIQIFDKNGNATQLIGEAENMNASTGVYANESELFITDFENNRVLSYKHNGELNQIITDSIKKPTDILLKDDVLYITNYQGKNLLKFKQK